MIYQVITEKISFIRRFYRVIAVNLIFAFVMSLFIIHKIEIIGVGIVVFIFFCTTIITSGRYRRFIYNIRCMEETIQVNYIDIAKDKEIIYDRKIVKITLELVPSRSLSKMHLIKFQQPGKSTLRIYSFSSWAVEFWDEAKINEVYGQLSKWKNGTIIG